MAYNRLNSLLKKKGWTGEEVGKLLIASMLNDIKQHGNPDKKPLFTQADFETMESSLKTDKDYVEYGTYATLYSSIVDCFNRGQALHQQFYNGFHRLMGDITECLHYEEALASLDSTPLIMTEEQYNRLEAEARSELEAYKESFCSLVFECLDYYMDEEEKAPENIGKALEATKDIPAKDNALASRYNETMGEGYYQLPDGRRSDKLSREEWSKAVEEHYLKTHVLYIGGEKAGYKDTLKDYNTTRLIELYKLLYKGEEGARDFYKDKTGEDLTPEEAKTLVSGLWDLADEVPTENPVLSKLLPYLDYGNDGEWHYYEEVPEDLTLYDLLALYIEAYRGAYADLDEKKALKLLKKDAPDLYKAIIAYIEKTAPALKGLKANQMYKELITWGELAKLHFTRYELLTEPEDHNIIDTFLKEEDSTRSKSYRYRVVHKGIAVIKKPNASQVDTNGNYIEKTPLFAFENLYSLEEDENKITDIMGFSETLIKPALSFLYSYNALLEILGRQYDIPDLTEASIDTSLFESKINGYNGLLYCFYHEVYGNKEEQERKRGIIKDIFPVIDLDAIKPTEEALKSVEDTIKDIGVSTKAKRQLKDLDTFIYRLSFREGV